MKLSGYLWMQFYGHFMHAEGLDRLRKLNFLFINFHIALLLVGSCDFLAGYGAECLSALASLDRQGYGFFFQQSRLLFCSVELLLRNLGIRRVVLTGCMTDCCVINTAFDAANRDFRVVVPRDLTRGSEHLEEPALRMISLHLGLVVDSDALLDEWRSQD